jgi:hypothetical protein
VEELGLRAQHPSAAAVQKIKAVVKPSQASKVK